MFAKKLYLGTALATLGAGCAGVPLVRETLTEPGALLFNGYTNPNADCYHCHGGEGSGRFLHGPDLYNEVPGATDEEIEKTIHKGKSIMPAYQGKLSDAEIDTLTHWLRGKYGGGPSSAPPGGPAPVPTSTTVAPSTGQGTSAPTPAPGAAPSTTDAPKS